MKRFVILIFLFFISGNAESISSYFMGMTNSSYIFIGTEFFNRIGIAAEHSVFTQGAEKQYVRIAPFYRFHLPYEFYGSYALFSGMRYDKGYYDFGARLDLSWNIWNRLMQVSGTYQPFYDSFIGLKNGYRLALQSIFSQHVGLFVGLKNIPDFRAVERRFCGGLIFDTPNISVKPEISVPTDGGTHLTRVSVSFVYKNWW